MRGEAKLGGIVAAHDDVILASGSHIVGVGGGSQPVGLVFPFRSEHNDANRHAALLAKECPQLLEPYQDRLRALVAGLRVDFEVLTTRKPPGRNRRGKAGQRERQYDEPASGMHAEPLRRWLASH